MHDNRFGNEPRDPTYIAFTGCIVLSYVQISRSQSNSADRYEIVRDTLIAFQSEFTNATLLLVTAGSLNTIVEGDRSQWGGDF